MIYIVSFVIFVAAAVGFFVGYLTAFKHVYEREGERAKRSLKRTKDLHQRFREIVRDLKKNGG